MSRLINVWAIAALIFAGACASDDSGGGGTADAGSDARGTTDTGVREDTGSPGTDTGVRDTGSPPQDTGSPPEDTGTPQDTSPPEDTRPQVDTSPPEDTAPQDTTPQDTAQDTAPDIALDTTPDVALDTTLDTTADTSVDTGDVTPAGSGASCDDPLNLLDFEVDTNHWLHAGPTGSAPEFPSTPGELYSPSADCSQFEDQRPDEDTGDDPAEVVYEFTAPETGLYWFSTFVTDETAALADDTLLYLLNDACTAEIACDDDILFPFNFLSEFYVDLVGGTTYYLVVEPFSGLGGEYGVEGGLVDVSDDVCNAPGDPLDGCEGLSDGEACVFTEDSEDGACEDLGFPVLTTVESEVMRDYTTVADDPFCPFLDAGETLDVITFTLTGQHDTALLAWSLTIELGADDEDLASALDFGFYGVGPNALPFELGWNLLWEFIDTGTGIEPVAGDFEAVASLCGSPEAVDILVDAGTFQVSVLDDIGLDSFPYHPTAITWLLWVGPGEDGEFDTDDDELEPFILGAESNRVNHDIVEE